ncbi:MarR family winged helix-turn-helix transcriptional regulator [Gordonia sp. CPCC 205333]|uniref:MarR family winged helix-turn-helix transcriptional regulator n=1 Tax=Gordonia sp. CPCC 205333 TaxID=3140790 RepID=UPI003AF3F409
MTVSDSSVAALLDELMLLGRAVRADITRADGAVGGLAAPLVGVLWALDASGPVRQNCLADKLFVSESVLSRQISKLVADGLLERIRDDQDGRATQVGITEAGRAALAAAMRRRFDCIAPKLTQWSDADATAALGTLMKLRSALSQ